MSSLARDEYENELMDEHELFRLNWYDIFQTTCWKRWVLHYPLVIIMHNPAVVKQTHSAVSRIYFGTLCIELIINYLPIQNV